MARKGSSIQTKCGARRTSPWRCHQARHGDATPACAGRNGAKRGRLANAVRSIRPTPRQRCFGNTGAASSDAAHERDSGTVRPVESGLTRNRPRRECARETIGSGSGRRVAGRLDDGDHPADRRLAHEVGKWSRGDRRDQGELGAGAAGGAAVMTEASPSPDSRAATLSRPRHAAGTEGLGSTEGRMLVLSLIASLATRGGSQGE